MWPATAEETLAFQTEMIRDLHVQLETERQEKRTLEDVHRQELGRLEDSKLELTEKLAVEEDVSYKLMTQSVLLTGELRTETEKNQVLLDQNESWIKENESLTRENESLVTKSQMKENESLSKENKRLSTDKQALTKKNQCLSRENKSLLKENRSLLQENQTLSIENKSLVSKMDSFSVDVRQRHLQGLRLEVALLQEGNLELSSGLRSETKKCEFLSKANISVSAELELERVWSQELKTELRNHKDVQQRACAAVEQSRDMMKSLWQEVNVLRSANQQLSAKLQVEEELGVQLQALIKAMSENLQEEKNRRLELQQELENWKVERSKPVVQLQARRHAFIQPEVYRGESSSPSFLRRVWGRFGRRKKAAVLWPPRVSGLHSRGHRKPFTEHDNDKPVCSTL